LVAVHKSVDKISGKTEAATKMYNKILEEAK
jgi:hypothetical protein